MLFPSTSPGEKGAAASGEKRATGSAPDFLPFGVGARLPFFSRLPLDEFFDPERERLLRLDELRLRDRDELELLLGDAGRMKKSGGASSFLGRTNRALNWIPLALSFII